jgi:hypothetical protein
MRVELLRISDCPNAAAARRVVQDCLARIGVTVPIIETVGPVPSPTVLVDSHDVMGGPGVRPAAGACRIDLPTTERVLAAMRASLGRS